MFAGKDEVFDAVTVHLDEVETLPPGMRVLAQNAVSAVQAAEIKCNGCLAWGVQYHPEYSLHDIAATFRRHGKRLIEEKFFHDEEELLDYSHQVDALAAQPGNKPLAWRLGVDSQRARQEFPHARNQQLDQSSGPADAQQARARSRMDFRGRHVVVTGGTGALGTALGRRAARSRRRLSPALLARR